MAKIKEVLTTKGTEVNYDILEQYVDSGEMVTYKQLCEILDIPYCNSGNAKKKQIDDIDRYYHFEKTGTKYQFINKRRIVLPSVDNRRSKYYDDIVTVLLYLLREEKNGVAIWSTGKALEVTNMVNNNYRIGKQDISITSQILDVNESHLYHFYNNTQDRFRRIFETALDRMESDMMILPQKTYMLCKKKSNGELDIKEATTDQIKIILNIANEALHSIGCVNLQSVIVSNRWENYAKALNKLLQEKMEIDFCYKAYKIIISDVGVERAIERIEKESSAKHLNKMCVESVVESKNRKLNNKDREVMTNNLIDTNNKLPLKYVIDKLKEKKSSEANEDDISSALSLLEE